MEAGPPDAAVATADAAPPEAGDDPAFAALTAPIEREITAGKLPGCVVAVGRHDKLFFLKAYGSRSLLPEKTPMTVDTVFDLASLTKPTATASSLMVLVDRGLIDLDARASTYVPELANLPPFTVRQLLIHTSGLPAVTKMSDWSTDRADLMRRIGALTLKSQPGAQFVYSDVGFVVLQEIVQRVSGKPLSELAETEVWRPLGMNETGFLPPSDLRARAAPTEWRDGGYMQGDVHDPRAFALGGVSGNAGVFSTAKDLSRFARAYLEHGVLDGKRVWSPEIEDKFLTRQDTSKGGRALGWDLDSSFATHRSPLLSPHAFGHGGYTGTAMWIDPDKDLFIVFLSNRVHPDGKGAVNPLVAEIAGLAVSALETKTGIDVLKAESFARLQNAHVAIVSNSTAKAKDGTTTIDALRNGGVAVNAIFTPEHGINADHEGKIGDASYNGIPVYSLYGEHTTPTDAELAGVDTIVFDLQDVGVRFYTYASTMKRAMKAAADHHLRFVVLDRPDPIGGDAVQGPVLATSDAKSFVNHHALPIRHGMTMGELAGLFVADDAIDLKPEVVKMTQWRREEPFAITGLAWTPPSPNLRSLKSVALYPAIGMLESTNVSVGRGTDLPFEVVAAPWLDPLAVIAKIQVAGVTFQPSEVTPTSSLYKGKKCPAIKIAISDPKSFEPIRTAVAIAEALHAVHPTEWKIDDMNNMLRSTAALDAIKAGKGLADVEATWAGDLAAFKARREQFLLYR